MRLFVFFWTVLVALASGERGGHAADAPSQNGVNESPLDNFDYQHWAFRPLVRPTLPRVRKNDWSRTPIDTFILAKQERHHLQPLDSANRLTLIRRLTFDLTGLPPRPEDVERFTGDDSPDAVERLIDRLLATPAYAERQAQHWLDLARFAETDGFEHDLVRPNAWRYRDWVIAALNGDMPYDEFTRHQIAADLLAPHDQAAAIATGFLLCGPDMPDQNNQEERRHLILNEMTSTVGSVFMGLQIGCAECHNHKFDPISQADFYRLRAFFESSVDFKDHPVPTESDLELFKAAQIARGSAAAESERRLSQLEDLGRQRLREKNPDLLPKKSELLAALTTEERQDYLSLTKQVEKLGPAPSLPQGRVVLEGKPRVARLFTRGDFRLPGAELDPGFPRIANVQNLLPANFIKSEFEINADAKTENAVTAARQPARLALARWLTQANNPLFGRVAANRLWQQHFVRALCNTPSDFGLMGEAPSHEELLDWLATELPLQGWSLKRTHRLLLTSATYQQQSRQQGGSRKRSEANEGNKLLVGMNPRRLDGEEIRDALLFAAGLLDARQYGPGVQPPLPAEVANTLLKNQWKTSTREADHYRRSIYLFVRRNLRFPLLDVFDRPDTNASCALRGRSTIAPQALTLLNSELTFAAAQHAAANALSADAKNNSAQINYLFQQSLNRKPTPYEQQAASTLLNELATENFSSAENLHLQQLRQLAVALFNLNEFVYVD